MRQEDYNRYIEFINKVLYEQMDISDYEYIMNKLDIPKVGENAEYIKFHSGCHNVDAVKGKGNLIFYKESRSFFCFSECNCGYTLLGLIQKRFKLIEDTNKTNMGAMRWLCEQLGIKFDFTGEDIEQQKKVTSNWKKIVSRYNKAVDDSKEIKLLNNSVLNTFERLYPMSWLNNGICENVLDKYGIGWYERQSCITIPCRDIDGNLIGVRGRYLNNEQKYMPISILNGTEYKFPTNKYLYGLWYTKVGISKAKKCLICESEKAVLQSETMFGDKNFCVGLYGKNISNEKRNQIIRLGVDEIIIGLDFDYTTVDSDAFENFKKDVYKIGNKFKPFCKVTALVSYDGHKLKDSPTDNGKEWYMNLWNNRENLY